MESPASRPVTQAQSSSIWPLRFAWLIISAVAVWALVGFFVFENILPNFYSLVMWVVMMMFALILFLVACISSVAVLLRARKIGDSLLKKKSIVRFLFSLIGLCISSLLLFLLILALVVIVGQL
jgi:hypothetical protein